MSCSGSVRRLWYYGFMEITYLGHSCFKLKNKAGLVVYLDPYKSDMVGTVLPKDVADVLVTSHSHEDHNAREVITGALSRKETFIIDKEGEYEIAGVLFAAIKTYHDKNSGADRGGNIVTSIIMDDVNVVHMGDIGHSLSSSQIDKLGSVDVLMIPVGGEFTVDAQEALEIVKDISPSYVIPMHYKTKDSKPGLEKLETLEKFLEKNKLPVAGEAVHKIKIDQGSLPDDTQILLMNG